MIPYRAALLAAGGVAGLASCRSRAAAALGLAKQPRQHGVTFAEVLGDLSALMNLVLVGAMVGMGLAFAVALAVRVYAPWLSRASLGAAVGFASVFALAVTVKVSLPILAWAVVAMLAMGVVSVAIVLRRVLREHGRPVPLASIVPLHLEPMP